MSRQPRPTRQRRGGAAIIVLLVITIGVVAHSGESLAAPTAEIDCGIGPQPRPQEAVDQVGYEPITPHRIVDTRSGVGGHRGVVPGDCTLRIQLDDALSDGATAVALSVTAVSEFRGFMTVFPCAAGRPPTSNLNTRDGVATPALVAVAPDVEGTICIYSKLDADVIVDVQGAWVDGVNRLTPITPIRAYDTRELPGRPPLPAGGIRNVPLAGVVLPDDATAVVANLTVTESSAPGWILAYPCGVEPPLASNGNYDTGESQAIAIIAGLGTRAGGEGQLCVRTKATTHFIVDVVGYYSPSAPFGPGTAVRTSVGRLVDTRTSDGVWTTPFAAEEIREFDPLAGRPDRAAATSVTLNAIGLNATSPGFLGFYPCTDEDPASRPTVSSLNTVPGRDVANLVTVELSGRGTVCVFSKSAADVVLDLVAVGAVEADSPLRRLDLGDVDVWPAFDPDVTDYAMVCPRSVTTFDMDAVGHQGRSVGIDGTPATSRRSVRVRLSTDDLLTIEVGSSPHVADTSMVTYSIRCLPSDFPYLRIRRPGDPTPGWYLTALTATTPASSFLMVLDHHGVPIWYQRVERGALNPQLLADGTVVFDVGSRPYGFDAEGVATIVDLDGQVIGTVTTDDPVEYPLDHHELLELPGGGWTTLSYPLRGGVDLTALNGQRPDDLPSLPSEDLETEFVVDDYIVDNSIREVDDDGQLVWEWTASEHFDIRESQYPVRFYQYRTVAERGEVDLFHINSVFRVDDGSNDYVISARHLDAVARINRVSDTIHDDGQVEWILTSELEGGAELVPNPDGAIRLDIVGDPLGGPRRPHDARLSGDVLTLFDNRTATGQPARAVAYRIDVDAQTATLLWQIDEPMGRSSPGLGANRPGGDESVLVDWGGLQPMFAEYTADGNLQMSIEQVPSGTAFRIVKYPVEAFDETELKDRAGDGPG